MAINLNLSGRKEDSTKSISVESPQYIKKVDFVDASNIYIGEAVPGTSLSDASWRIYRVEISSDATDNDITIGYAGGSSSFDKKWSDHLQLQYS